MDMFELLAALVGFIIYWFLSSKKKKDNRSMTSKKRVEMPEVEYQNLPEYQMETEEYEEAENEEFKRLLKEFADKEERKKGLEEQGQLIDAKKAEQRAIEQLSGDVEVVNRERDGRVIYQSIDQASLKKNTRSQRRGSSTKRKSTVQELLSSPHAMKNAFIFKEIIDRKEW
ncbi:hypothetical protein [Algivirga pacifica]|uniref:Uncharacterized protein n=1 Tax=Algivirga pacifica TaxID=1162670 RepID=A0ABP9D8A3_9BACT